MAKSYRPDRLGEEIRRIVSSMLLSDIKDPRLQGKFISITGVDVTSDLSYATCYVSVLGTSGGSRIYEDASEEAELENQQVIEGLSSAAGLFRSEIGRQVKVRHNPELIFKLDNSLAYGRHIESVIKNLDIKPEEPVATPEDENTESTED